MLLVVLVLCGFLYTEFINMAATRLETGVSMESRHFRTHQSIMASFSSCDISSVVLSETDIPGASLEGRTPSVLKNDELKFWLKCRGDSLKGLRTKAQLVKR